jgi:hypothetical protein
MSKENLNNIPGWKANLDALDNLPGENAYDKSDAWEKLHVRLSDSKKTRIKAWYWIAAACIFFALLLSLFYPESNIHHAMNSSLHEHQPSIKTVSGEKGDKVPATNLTMAGNEKKILINPSKTMAKTISENTKEIVRISHTVSSTNLLPPTESNFMTPLDTLSSFVSIQPENKKLKVVHINELGDPVETLPEIVKNSDKHAFQFKIANQETYINPATASNSNDFTIIRIKPSQN